MPQTPPLAAAAREVAIPPGATATATWDLRGYRGVEVKVSNIGREACAFDGPTGEAYLLRPGKVVVLSVREGGEFALPIRSLAGTRIRLALAAWRTAAPPTRILGTRKLVTRDPKTHVITSIIETPVWVVEEPR